MIIMPILYDLRWTKRRSLKVICEILQDAEYVETMQTNYVSGIDAL